MRPPTILTFADVIDWLNTWAKGHAIDGEDQSTMKMVVQQSMTDLINATDWPWLMVPGQVVLEEAQTSSTITYTQSTRTLTLASGTWPADSAERSVRIGDVLCDVEEYTDSTNLKLHEINNPGQDVAAGTSYVLYKRYYELPADFTRFIGPFREGTSFMGAQASLAEIRMKEASSDDSGDMRFWHVGRHPDKHGYKALYVWPRATETKTLPFMYWKEPRALRFSGHDNECYAGTVTCDETTTLAGDSTSWTSEMVGSIIRIGGTSANPDGRFGKNPYVDERSLATVTDTTTATLDSAATQDSASLHYRISDPIDIDPSAHNAFLRLCEANLADVRNVERKSSLRKRSDDALLDAMAAADAFRWQGHQPATWGLSAIATVTDPDDW